MYKAIFILSHSFFGLTVEKEAEDVATPQLCIINERKKRLRGRPKKDRSATTPSTSTKEDRSSLSSEGTSHGDVSLG